MTKKRAPQNSDNRLALMILVCFFFSGLTALIYEIIWMRMIGEVIGAAPFAVSIILFVFMGGMGVGSFLASRRIDDFNATRLIRTYGTLELLIGIYAFFVPIILLVFKFFYSMLYNKFFDTPFLYNSFIFAGALLLLGLPTLCMGATLPILCKFYVARLSHLGTHTGRLYGLNTIGAAVGSLLCGFWMIQALSVWGTLLLAVAINCTIGLICMGMAPQTPLMNPSQKQRTNAKAKKKSSQPSVPTDSSEPSPIAQSSWKPLAALVIFLVSGFSAMAYEVIWTKLLGLLVGPTTYSFTIVLATFIVGLALGNMIFGWLADRVANVIGVLVTTQITAALLAMITSQIMGDSQLFFAKLIYTFKDHFTTLSMAKAGALMLLMMPPTLLLGATFPLVAKIYSRSLSHVGRSIGVAYTVNTIGAVLGSLCAGLILIPLVGKENGLRIIIGLQLSVAIVIGFVVLIRQHEPLFKLGALAMATATGIFLCTAFPSWNHHLLAKGKYHRFEEISFGDELLSGAGWLESLFRGDRILAPLAQGELVYYGDGIGGFTTVLKYPGLFGTSEFSLANSGKMDASSRGDMNTQTALAHFPMLFADNPENVMVLGLASGITAGEVLNYPIKRLDVIDINDRVAKACRFFDHWNNKVLDNPKTHLIFQDGRAHLALTNTTYDVIISEPSNPWMAGMATLFTKDFFELAKKRLNENGIYVQWFHCYQMDWSTFTLIGRTFADVFPNGLLVSTSPEGFGRDYLLVGLNSEKGLNWENAHKAITYLNRSSNISMTAPELYAPQIVSENLKFLFGEGPINTDDLPLLEFSAPKLMYSGQKGAGMILRYLSEYPGLSEETRKTARAVKQNPDTAINFAAYALSIHSAFKGMVDLAHASQQTRQRYYDLLKSYCTKNPFEFDLVGDSKMADALRDIQIKALEQELVTLKKQVDHEDQQSYLAVDYSYLAGLYDVRGAKQKAIDYLKKSLQIKPDNVENLNNLGYLLDQQGNVEAALHNYKEAILINPYSLISLGNLAYLCMKSNRLDDAMNYFEAILRIQPEQVEALFQMGNIYKAKNDLPQAVKFFEKALQLDPNYTDARNALIQIR